MSCAANLVALATAASGLSWKAWVSSALQQWCKGGFVITWVLHLYLRSHQVFNLLLNKLLMNKLSLFRLLSSWSFKRWNTKERFQWMTFTAILCPFHPYGCRWFCSGDWKSPVFYLLWDDPRRKWVSGAHVDSYIYVHIIYLRNYLCKWHWIVQEIILSARAPTEGISGANILPLLFDWKVIVILWNNCVEGQISPLSCPGLSGVTLEAILAHHLYASF